MGLLSLRVFHNFLHFYAFFALSAMLWSCSSGPRAKDPQKKKAEIYFEHGTKYLVGKDYTQALDYLTKAYRLDPKNDEILNNLGMTYFLKKRPNQAERYLKLALDLNEKNSDARNNLAGIYLSRGELEEAEREYRKVQQDLIYRGQFRVSYNLGQIAWQRGHINKAKGYFRASIKDNDMYCPAHFKLGEIYYMEKKFKKSYESFLNASKGTCYNLPAPHYYQALMLFKLKKIDEARIKLEEVKKRFEHSRYATLANVKLKSFKNLTANQISKMKLMEEDFGSQVSEL